MNQHAGQDRTRERIELKRDLALQRARLAEAQAAIAESRQSRTARLAETQRALRERQAQASLRREQLAQERHKTEQRSRLTQLTAPVDGTVQQLAVHTAVGVVTPAQVLMVVVPRDAAVTAEVVLENKDVSASSAPASKPKSSSKLFPSRATAPCPPACCTSAPTRSATTSAAPSSRPRSSSGRRT